MTAFQVEECSADRPTSIAAFQLGERPDQSKMSLSQVKNLLCVGQIKDLLEYSSQNLKNKNFASSKDVKRYNANNPKRPVVGFSPSMIRERDDLQSLLHAKLYLHYRVVRMTDKARRIIRDLFEVYVKNPNQLPYSIYPRSEKVNQKTKYRIICNYIASMTDRFALDEHKKLFDPYQKV